MRNLGNSTGRAQPPAMATTRARAMTFVVLGLLQAFSGLTSIYGSEDLRAGSERSENAAATTGASGAEVIFGGSFESGDIGLTEWTGFRGALGARAGGLAHSSDSIQSTAKLNRLGTDGLDVTGAGDLVDLVRAELGEAEGYGIELDFSDAPAGSTFIETVFGDFEGAQEGVSVLNFDQSEDAIQVSPDFGSIGTIMFELQLFNGGEVVFSQSGMVGAAGSFPRSAVHASTVVRPGLIHSYTVRSADGLFEFQVAGGPSVEAEIAVMTAENPSRAPDFLYAVDTIGFGLGMYSINAESVRLFDNLAHSAIGRVAFEASLGRLEVSNFDLNPQKGVRIDLDQQAAAAGQNGFLVELDPVRFDVEPSLFVDVLDYFDPNATESQTVGYRGVSGDTIVASADFLSIGCTEVGIDFRSGQASQAFEVCPAGDLFSFEADSSPFIPEIVGVGTEPTGIWTQFGDPGTVTLSHDDSVSYSNVDNVVISPAGCATASAARGGGSLSTLSIRAMSLDSLAITDEVISGPAVR